MAETIQNVVPVEMRSAEVQRFRAAGFTAWCIARGTRSVKADGPKSFASGAIRGLAFWMVSPILAEHRGGAAS